MGISDRLMHAWNAFTFNDPYKNYDYSVGSSYSLRQYSNHSYISNDRSIVTNVLNQIAVDVAAIELRHVKLDENDRYTEDIPSGLNYCLTEEANIDQSGVDFRQDIAMTVLEKGVAAVVPVDTDVNPRFTNGYDIKTLRVGEVVEWFPEHVRVDLYNDRKGVREQIILPKTMVAIIQNPLYAIMNEPNSILQRLLRKLALMDKMDEQVAANNLDMIIKLPYVVKSESRRKQAEQRRNDIEFQLKSSQYGVAYVDGTEEIVQLNRPIENNFYKTVDGLTDRLYFNLGLTKGILDGTANEQEMLNYMNRTVKPIVESIRQSMKRTFLSKTARTQKQSIVSITDPFKLVPINNIAEIADKFTRNEILSSNEVRSLIGFRPSSDPKADELRNSNMPVEKAGLAPPEQVSEPPLE